MLLWAYLIARSLRTSMWAQREDCWLTRNLRELALPGVAVLLQWAFVATCRELQWPIAISRGVASVITAWITIRVVYTFHPSLGVKRLSNAFIITLALLNTFGLLTPGIAGLESISIRIGDATISLLSVLKGTLLAGVLLWGAQFSSGKLERWIKTQSQIEPSLKELFSKLIRIFLIVITIYITLETVGIDLSAFALFSGAIGLGIGFGLQKVVSNLICGVILLMDRSIKPGDVIALDSTFGEINKLGARYVSVRTLSGKEHLIPNELFITERTENWSHSDRRIRISLPVRAPLYENPHHVMKIIAKAPEGVSRVLQNPKPELHLIEFGAYAIEYQLRVWIGDPERGVFQVTSDIYLRLWDLFKEYGIEIPYPHQQIQVKAPNFMDKTPWASGDYPRQYTDS